MNLQVNGIWGVLVLAADKMFRTTLFGLGCPAPHRVVANAVTAGAMPPIPPSTARRYMPAKRCYGSPL